LHEAIEDEHCRKAHQQHAWHRVHTNGVLELAS
jgi:hypothetical protein